MELHILGYKCKKCSYINYPNRTLCRKCGHDAFEPVPLPKKGKLLTYTQLFNLPGDFEVADMMLGIVELENGVRMTAQIKVDSPKIGMPVQGKVEVVRQVDYEKRRGMVFYAR
ncbi:MAG: OB-fold domain-containing protein [candidate division NC10 bacterium]